jgi:RNA-directed DNA polymerase
MPWNPFGKQSSKDSSYGFRPGRGCHDAIERIYNLASAKSNRRWVLDADIKGAFDNIDHEKLMTLIGNFPARELVRQWLKAGIWTKASFTTPREVRPKAASSAPYWQTSHSTAWKKPSELGTNT